MMFLIKWGPLNDGLEIFKGGGGVDAMEDTMRNKNNML